MNISLSQFAPEKFGLARRIRQSRPASAYSSPYTDRIWCLLAGFLLFSAAASIYSFKPPYAIGSVPSLSGHAITYRWCSLPRVRRHRASKLLLWQVTMDHFICASLSHTHHWHQVGEVGMFKVPSINTRLLLYTHSILLLYLCESERKKVHHDRRSKQLLTIFW